MVLRRLLKTIQSEENSFEDPRRFETEEWLKMGEKRKNLYLGGCDCRIRQVYQIVYHAIHSDETVYVTP